VDPKYAVKLEDLERRLLKQRGTLDATVRRAAAGEGEVASTLDDFVDKVRRHAYRVTDEDIDRLRGAGYSEDQIFELTVAAAYGAARRRLDAGLAALAGHRAPEEQPAETSS
jgi:alkylhydroperoxidase family enzyme